MSDDRTQHVCLNGHEVPVLVQMLCKECYTAVPYEPCSIGMALVEEIDRLCEVLANLREVAINGNAIEAGGGYDKIVLRPLLGRRSS